MGTKQSVAALLLLVLLAATIYGVYRTGPGRAVTVVSTGLRPSDSSVVVDQSSLTTAQQLVALPTAPDERPLAEEALRLADQEMDLAFAEAVRTAAMQPRATTVEARAADARLQLARGDLIADQGNVARLSAAVARASQTDREALTDHLNLAKARVVLDQDEADDANQDLMRAGGDPQARVQVMIDQHDAASKRSDSTRVSVMPLVDAAAMAAKLKALDVLRQKQQQLRQARAEADSLALVFTRRHALLGPEVGRDSGLSPSNGASRAESEDLLLRTQRRAGNEKTRSALDQRVDNQRQLSDIYMRWSAVVGAQQRAVVNQLLRDVAIILIIGLVGLLIDGWIEDSLGALSMDRRRLQTLYTATRVSLQLLGILLVLLVIFGIPNNFGTFLGLAGAGLTVVLKDFIVGFFGWFVLMGRNGIRIGDLVEINGVTGEVVELGIFHTMLLETGSWSDSGHPTGRRVTFLNSFAIEGHYFNFSTSGQWLWDEVRIVVPAGRDPRPIVDAIKKQVEEVTAGSALKAEQQWKGARRSPHVNALTAAPTVVIKPIIGGIEITARYLTHVGESVSLRSSLYNTAIEMLGERQQAPPFSVAAPRPSP